MRHDVAHCQHNFLFSFEIYVDLVSVSRPCLAGRLFSGLELLG